MLKTSSTSAKDSYKEAVFSLTRKTFILLSTLLWSNQNNYGLPGRSVRWIRIAFWFKEPQSSWFRLASASTVKDDCTSYHAHQWFYGELYVDTLLPKLQVADCKTLLPAGFIFTARCTLVQSAVLRSHVVCLSVCLSVTLVNCDHIGWNSSKIISPLVSLGCSLFATPT